MKIITLLPVKNEDWILEKSLENFSKFSDLIIVLDDNSKDKSLEVANKFEKVKVVNFNSTEKVVNMSQRRNILLEEGRKEKGSHFVFLDADELLSENFINKKEEYLNKMNPGEKLLLPWINIEKINNDFYFKSSDKINFKDFIFCDDGQSKFESKFLSETRTPKSSGKEIQIDFENGYVWHLRKVAPYRDSLKQAWYMCNELIEGSRNAKRINATYEYNHQKINKGALEQANIDLKKLDTSFSENIILSEILNLFNKKGILYFEALDIWNINKLAEQFKKETGRKPESKKYPSWILKINNLKNKIKNNL